MRLAAALLAFAAVAPAQQTPVFQSETRMVLVDAVITGKKGESVRELAAKDFRIWEDGKEQAIRSFSVEPAVSPSEPGHLVLFFDDSGMTGADQVNARRIAAAFADADASPSRLMAVVNFAGGFRVAQNFTANAERLKQAVNTVSLSGTNLGSEGMPIRPGMLVARGSSGLLNALGALVGNLNLVPGRKVIVLFTGGDSLANSQSEEVAAFIRASNRSNVAIYPMLQSATQPRSVIDCAQRQGRGRIGFDSAPCTAVDQSIPLAIADGTGGFVAPPSNDIAGDLRKIAEEQAEYYVLGFTPLDSKEGACHSLRVKVDRPGASVRVRSSYCSTKPQDLLAASRVVQDLEKHATSNQTGAAVALQAPFFYASPNVARVHVSMEIDTRAIKVETVKGKPHAEVNLLGIAASADGATAARFSDALKRDFENRQELDHWRAEPLHYEKEFKILPGQYHLVVAFSSGGASFGKADASIEIPAYRPGQLNVSGIVLSRKARAAADLGLGASLTGEETPFIAGDLQFVPTGSPDFTKGQPGFAYLEIEAPQGADPVKVNVAALDPKTGAVVRESGAQNVARPAAGGTKIPVGLALSIGQLAPGKYRLKITAVAGRQEAARTLDFAVTR